MTFAPIKDKLHSLGIDSAALKPNGTTTFSTPQGTLWVKNYQLTVSSIPINVVIVGSYNGTTFEDGERVLSLFEPLGNAVDFGMIDINELMAEIRAEQLKVEKIQEDEKKKRNEQAARDAEEYLANLKGGGKVNLTESAYLKRKKLPQQPGTWVEGTGDNGTLIVPMIGEYGRVWNFQRITPDGGKYMQKDARTIGCYHVVKSGASNTVLIGEGYATCLSVAMAFDSVGKRPNIICAFNSPNLAPVVQAMRKLHPQKQIIILADNDQWKKENTGILAAQKCGVPFIAPEFDLSDEATSAAKPTDFNDLHCLISLPEVLRQVQEGITRINQVVKEAKTLAAKPPKVEGPTEIKVAEVVLEQMGDGIVGCGEDLFLWNKDGYWQHLEKGSHTPILSRMIDLFGPDATAKKVRGAFDLFKVRIPQVHPDIFTQKKMLCNFVNGTLVFDKGIVSLKAHDKNDLLTYSLPFLCPTEIGAMTLNDQGVNPLVSSGSPGSFIDLVHGITEGDSDKKTLVAEMLGAMLFPIFPQIFFILGKPNNGKSTLAKIALNLVGFRNCSAVSPSRLFGFNLHQALGKRVNYDLDIPTGRPLTDDVLKKVIDQVPIQIERKNRDSVMATLPPVHLYVGNDLPDLSEGNAKPMERRVSFLFVNRGEIATPDKQFVERILRSEFETVIRTAIWGAMSLFKKNGAYSLTTDKTEALSQWELDSSSVLDLLDQFKGDGVPVYDDDGRATGDRIVIEREGMVTSAILHSTIKKVAPRVGRNKFFKFLEGNGFQYSRDANARYFKGLGIRKKEEIV